MGQCFFLQLLQASGGAFFGTELLEFDAGGPAGTTIVIRGRDPDEVEGAEREVLELARSLGVEPEKARDSR